jgi:hypothetical protein
MITAVMPSAMMPTNAKLRVTLKRFFCVAKVSVATESSTTATTAATNTQGLPGNKPGQTPVTALFDAVFE